MTATSDTSQYYLQDSRGNVGDNLMFWAKGGGYTSDVSAAEPFSKEDAFAQNHSRGSDIPWPTAYIDARTRPVVDMQYVKHEEARTYVDGDQFYVQRLPRDYVGNDIVFIAEDDSRGTTDLSKARVFSSAELFINNVQQVYGIAWPKAYIVAKSRQAADYHLANLKEALQDQFKELAKPEKVKPERYRCHGCGIFLSVGAYYGSECPRCSTDNRP